jgi:GAF domain-containing protein
MTEPSPSTFSSKRRHETAVTPVGVFAELGKLLHPTDDFSMNQVLQRIAELAAEVLPDLGDVSVTLIEHARAKTTVFTGSLAPFLDERQYEQGFGPCLDAAVSGATIIVDTSDPIGAYPDFSRVAADRGVTHVLAVGLPIPQRIVGALNLYSTTPQPITPDAVALAEAFAGYAAVAVANANLYHSAAEEARHMHEALKTRAVIEQAKGILMAGRHCTADEAFLLLAQASQHQNRKLRDIAAQVVERTHTAPGARGPAAGRSNGTTLRDQKQH